MSMDGKGRTKKAEQTEWGQMLDRMATDVKRNEMDDNCDGAAERSMSVSSVTMACKIIFIYFFFYFMFLFFSSSSSSKAITKATHYMTTSSKTHKSA
jgi:hypothetical protein